MPPKIDNQQIQTLPTGNISTNNFKASNTDSAAFELSPKEPKEVEEYTVGNYADLFRLIVGYYRELKYLVSYFNLIEELEQYEFCFLPKKITAFEPNNEQKIFFENRRFIIVGVTYEGKGFLICELEPKTQIAYRVFVKSTDNGSTLDPNGKFSVDDVKYILNEMVRSCGKLRKIGTTKVYKFYHAQTSPKDNALRILEGIGFFKTDS